MEETGDGRTIDDADLVPVSGQLFRDCIARVPSGVNVITTDGPLGLGGFTATAVASVSDAPPTVLVCLNRSSQQSRAFRGNGRFAVNLLPAGGPSRAAPACRSPSASPRACGHGSLPARRSSRAR
jgi:flavin reductase (DIM6/NTAB) family NADH-FMN oxidoreductase RutF